MRDLKNFLALGTPGGTGGCSPVLMLVKLVAPHLPAEIISWLMNHIYRCEVKEMHVTLWQGSSVSLHTTLHRMIRFVTQSRKGVIIAAQLLPQLAYLIGTWPWSLQYHSYKTKTSLQLRLLFKLFTNSFQYYNSMSSKNDPF